MKCSIDRFPGSVGTVQPSLELLFASLNEYIKCFIDRFPSSARTVQPSLKLLFRVSEYVKCFIDRFPGYVGTVQPSLKLLFASLNTSSVLSTGFPALLELYNHL
jgi:hypothetical protein